MKPFNIFALLTLNFDGLDVYTFVMLRWFRVNINFKPVVNSSGVVWISSPHGHVKECGFRNPVNFCMSNPGSWKFFVCGIRDLGNFCLWNPESWAFESAIQLYESGIPLKQLESGIQVPLEKIWNPVIANRNP